MEEAQRPLTVSEVNRAVKTCVERSFPQLWVRGELSDLTVHASGHVYFSLKDATSQLRGAAFRYAQQAMQMRLERGMEVDVCGRITVYEPRGEYQLQASSITPVGAGELNRLFEELKLKLGAEGLFDPSRKRPIPTMPRIIGLITSWSGAAIQDFLRVLNRRFSGMHVRVIPSLVQGAEAPPKLIKAIEYFNKTHSCDVVVLTRGGGSVEDLWAFNDEQLARAIAASEIPVVSAVGHERDHSISDFVADYAAATPTAAAEFLVRGKAELGERLETIEKRMAGVMQLRVANLHRRYERASSCPMLSHPEDYVNRLSQQVDYLGARLLSALPGLATARRQRLDYLESRLLQALPGLATARRQRLDYAESRLLQVLPSLATTRRQRLDAAAERLPQAMERQMAEWTHRLERIAVGMNALNPKSVLTRGYSILLDGGGHAVRRADETFEGAKLHALLGEGELDVAVESVKEARG